ncbi:MAG: hypothetical protein JO009_12090 [Candidatus Eremiobacteraeota bacterium]|nr:hypothetical protein [Candidatus Eremiobacteraeota bacterium]
MASPSPAATPTPLFTYWGVVREYYFGRTNGDTCLTCKPKGSPNATAFNNGGELHGQINIPHTPFALGATYFGAYPFGANWPGPLNNIGYNPEVDNTVPGYPISIFGETYLQYKTAGTFFQTGKEVLRASMSPWTPPSDTRVTPESFQGTLISTNPTPDLSIGAMYMARFRSRVTSAFNSNTLLTSCNVANPTGSGPVEGVKGTFTVPGDTCQKQQTTYGFSEFSLGYIFGNSGLVANAYQYEIYNIASMTWLTSQYNFDRHSIFNPFVGGHFLAENNLGTSVIGTVHNYTGGGQIGATVYHNVLLSVAYDGSPATRYVVPLKDCKGTPSAPASPAPGVIFGGVADTSDKNVPTGDVACYGGGLASPYTVGYTSDPLYTTSLTQGMPEVIKPGTGVKAVLAWQTDNRRIRAYASDAWYNYSLPGSIKGVGNGDARAEFDLDAWFFFNPVPTSGPYKGLSLRQRYGDRTQPFAPFEFKSSRTQLEYDF